MNETRADMPERSMPNLSACSYHRAPIRYQRASIVHFITSRRRRACLPLPQASLCLTAVLRRTLGAVAPPPASPLSRQDHDDHESATPGGIVFTYYEIPLNVPGNESVARATSIVPCCVFVLPMTTWVFYPKTCKQHRCQHL